MNLTELLQKLSEIEPEVCEKYATNAFVIGDYIFAVPEDTNELVARYMGHDHVYTGPPALAWLRDAVERAIEARGWSCETGFWVYDNQPRHRIYIHPRFEPVIDSDKTTALLAAFVAAVGAVKEGE